MIDKNYNLSPILLNIGIAKHNCDWNYINISNPFFRIYLVIEGEAEIEINKEKYKLTPGNFYLIPPFVQHNDSCSGVFSLYYLHVFENQNKTISLFEQYDFPVRIDANELLELLVERLLEINPNRELLQYDPKVYTNDSTFLKSLALSGQMSLDVLLETKGILCQLLSKFISQAHISSIRNDDRIWRAVHYIRDNIHKKIKISELSASCHLSEDHLIRLFKKELNTTPIAYINRKKIERAQLMLLLNNTTIKEVTCSLAFDNISYFNKVFKTILKKTPTEYLKDTKLFK